MEPETYHQYQQILEFQGTDTGVLKHRRARKKFKKSLDGCLSCKKRRKKCDETKPTCHNCTRIGLVCEWPSHVDASVTASVTPSVAPSVLMDQFLNIQMENNANNTERAPLQTSVHVDLSKMDSSLSHIDAPLEPAKNHTIPGVVLDNDDQLCYNTFIDTFLPSITSSHSPNETSQPLKLFTPFASVSHTALEIFLACGATLLCFNNDEYQKLANDKYIHCVNLLIKDLQTSPTGCEDHLFISVQLLQTLCLRDKNIGLNATKSASHLNASYEILKRRKTMTLGRPTVLDKVLCEYFVFNYPLTLMLCHHAKLSQGFVPSPFEFFNQLSGFLQYKIVDQGDVWMNHPMLGISLRSLEISAKTAWLCRLLKLPITHDDLTTAQILKRQCDEEFENLSRIKVETDGQKINKSFAKTHLQACSIILRKIVDWNITIEQLQPTVNQMIEEFQYCGQVRHQGYSEPGAILSIWCLFICGSATLTIDQREFLTLCFMRMAKKIKSSLALKILKYFNIIWNDDYSKINHSIGFEFLFDTTVLDIVCT